MSGNNRAVVVFPINRMAVALAKLKDSGKQDSLALGVDQIRRYHSETPEMFVATQVFEVIQTARLLPRGDLEHESQEPVQLA